MPRILCIDDWPDLLELLAHALRGAGYEVGTASSMESALFAVQNNHFDLAIIDFFLNGESGLELAAQLKKIVPSLRVIIMTGTIDGDELTDKEFPVFEKASGAPKLLELVAQVLGLDKSSD